MNFGATTVVRARQGSAVASEARDEPTRQQVGGVSLVHYATATAAREALIDDARIAKVSSRVTGDLDAVWAGLTEHARIYALPFRPGDLEKTNRIADWDRLILLDRDVQASWRQLYPRALAKVCGGVDSESSVGRRIAAHLLLEPHLLWNPLMPLGMRKAGITLSVAYHARDLTGEVPLPFSAMRRVDVDAAVFPGEPVATLMEFARLEVLIEKGDFMGALYRAGLDPASYARVSRLWADALARDPAMRAEYAEILGGAVALRQVATMLMRPAVEAEIFPGEILSKVSDFARIGRAAQRGEFRRALVRAGVDLDTFARLTARFNARMHADAEIETQFRALMKDARLDG